MLVAEGALVTGRWVNTSRQTLRYVPAHRTAGTCTVIDDDERLCRQDALPGMETPMCVAHALAAYRYVVDRLASQTFDLSGLPHVPGIADEAYRGRRGFGQERPDFMNGWDAVVYYVRVGDLIKIGTTGFLRKRIRSYPPDARLLAVEPGGPEVERQRHQQFKKLRVARNEWFRAGAELVEHIERLAVAGLPEAPSNRPADQASLLGYVINPE